MWPCGDLPLRVFCVRVQIRELYQMHVRSTTVPPNYAKLLQLRDMLELPARDAAALEAEVLGSGASFSI